MNKQIIIDYEEYLTLEHINKIHMNEMNKLRNCVVIPEEEYEKYKQLEQENKELKEDIDKLTSESTEWEDRYYRLQDKWDVSIIELENKNKELQNKIDKAIDFIENRRSGHDWYDRKDLLEILKGDVDD